MKKEIQKKGMEPRNVFFLEKKERIPAWTVSQRLKNLQIARQDVRNLREAMEKKENPFLLITSFSNNLYALCLSSLLRDIPSACFLHNIRDWVNIPGIPNPSSKKRVFSNRRVLKNLGGVFFIEEYLRKNAQRWIRKPGYVFPFRLSRMAELKLREQTIQGNPVPSFVVPGIVSSKSRDYDSVFAVFSDIRENFRLIFLGAVKEPQIVEEGKKLLGERLVTFENYLEEEEFQKHLLSSHFLIGSVKEGLYGEYQGSGVEFDGPTIGIPTIIRASLFPQNENGFFLRYNSIEEEKEIVRKGIKSIQNKTYMEIYQNPAFEKAADFLEEKWEKQLEVDIRNVIEERRAKRGAL